MNRSFGAGLLAGLLCAVLGCGSKVEEGIPVSGIVAIDGQPASNATVVFIPQETTKGQGGTGTTDATGRYTILNPRGGNTLPLGKYKVTISRRLNADGSPADPKIPPLESPARESLPPIYTSSQKTQLSVTLNAGDKKSFDFDLKVKK